MNAQIGKVENYELCLHNLLNRNEEYVTGFLLENRLAYLIHKMVVKLWTYTSRNNAKAQLDYMFINKKWINSVVK